MPIRGADLSLDVPADPEELALVRHSLTRWLEAADVEEIVATSPTPVTTWPPVAAHIP